MAPTPSLEDLINTVVEESSDDHPLTRLRTAAALARSVNDITDAALGYFVDQARRAGHSWSEIGESLGVSKQAAQQRQRARAAAVLPPVTLERFTPRARGVLAESDTVARELGHDYIGTEHLLLAQYAEPEGLAAIILTESGLPAEAARDAVVEEVGRGPGAPDGKLPFIPEATAVLSGALSSAVALGHNYIGTEHLLLGVTQTEAAGSRILRASGLDEATVRARLEVKMAELLARRAGSRAQPPQPAQPAQPAPPAEADAPPARRRPRAPRTSSPRPPRS